MLKSLVTIAATALAVDTLATIRHNRAVRRAQDKKRHPSTVAKINEERNRFDLMRASNRITHREHHGEYIGAPADQKMVDLEFELITGKF